MLNGAICCPRVCLVVLEINERGLGSAKKADLALSVKELAMSSVVAIGECTGADPSWSEAKQLIQRLKDVNDLGFMFASTTDTA